MSVTVVPDATNFIKAMTEFGDIVERWFAQVVEVFDEVGRKMVGWWNSLTADPAISRLLAIERYGRRNVTDDGGWITDLCAGWLHGSCPAGEHCDCRCHR